eukprot:Sdes_comp20123_c0_seq1m13168
MFNLGEEKEKMTILCWNANGLSPDKLRKLSTMIADELVEIVIVMETWYIQWEEVKTNPYYIYHTPRPANPRTSGHQNGGMLILASHKVSHLIKIQLTNDFFISCQTGDRWIAIAYFPPSLGEEEIIATLRSSNPADILLGDFKFRRGKVNGDTSTTAPRRKEPLEEAAAEWGLEYVENSSNECSRTDHLFSRIPIPWS